MKDIIVSPNSTAIIRLERFHKGWKKGVIVNHILYNLGKNRDLFELKIVKEDQKFIFVKIFCKGKKNQNNMELGTFEIVSSNTNDLEIYTPV